MSEGGIVLESKPVVGDGTEKSFDILNKTIHLPDLKINFPNSEELPAGRKRESRFMHLNNPNIFSEQIQANAKYLKGAK